MKRGKYNWVLLVLVSSLLIIFSQTVISEFNIYNGEILKGEYSSGELVSGKINFSLIDQKNSILTTSFNSTPIVLSKFLEENYILGEDYSCNPGNCLDDYLPTNAEENKFVSLNSSQKEEVGFRIGSSSTEIFEITGFSMNLSSNASFSCSVSQLELDFFDDGTVDIVNNKYRDFECGRSRGCYDSVGSSEFDIVDERYCELIPFSGAPAYKIGGNILNKVNGSGVQFELISQETGELLGDDCIVQAPGSGFKEMSCIINHSSSEAFNAFVCVSSEDDGYRIRGESTGEICGKFGLVGDSFTTDYDLFGSPLQYDYLDMEIDQEFYETQTGKILYEEFESYIDSVYGGGCGDSGCVFPISVKSSAVQTVNFKNASIRYASNQGSASEERFYELETKKAILNSLKPLEIDLLDLNITVPDQEGESELAIYLDEEEIFKTSLNISLSFDYIISPTVSLIGRQTEFKVVSSENISNSVWKFGDNSLQVSSNGNSARHTYVSEGEYDLTVTAKTNSGQTSERTFKIFVGDAKTSAELSLSEYNKALEGLEGNLSKNYPSWISKEIREELGLDFLKQELADIQKRFDLITTDENYTAIALELSVLGTKIPMKLEVSEIGGAPMEVNFNQIDTDHIYEISDAETDSGRDIDSDILSWMSNNYRNSVNYKIYSVQYSSGEVPILTSFEIELDRVGSDPSQSYLIIEYPLEEVVFSSNIGAQEVGGSATYVALEGNQNERIEFLVSGSGNVESLRAYISPDVGDLGSGSTSLVGLIKPPKFNTVGFFIWLFVVLLLTLGIYIALQEWYKRKYESYLFKKGSDLYNIINFIYNARKSGLEDDKIRSSLKGRKWKGEQVTYAFKKIEGKRTGMFEIPLFKFLENKKIRKEIGRRQTGPVDTRFIKRPKL